VGNQQQSMIGVIKIGNNEQWVIATSTPGGGCGDCFLRSETRLEWPVPIHPVLIMDSMDCGCKLRPKYDEDPLAL
jgi:hypothetical protein